LNSIVVPPCKWRPIPFCARSDEVPVTAILRGVEPVGAPTYIPSAGANVEDTFGCVTVNPDPVVATDIVGLFDQLYA
jgi:hypothetical protein